MDFAKSWERCDSIMRSLSICPAQAGVIPLKEALQLALEHLSRASGGDPTSDTDPEAVELICPAQAGVILCLPTLPDYPKYLSRASGGDPCYWLASEKANKFVPRKRG